MPRKNFITHRISFSVQAISAFALAGLMVLLGGSEASARSCRTVYGHFINQVLVPPPTCTSPVNTCVRGRAIGGLSGDFFATITSITPSIDTAVTAVVFETADLVLHTKDGDLLMKEAAAYNGDPNGHGDLGDVVTVVGGTGKWVGATGRLRVWGNLTPSESDVNYDGEVCRP
ncbi:MAG: hypothetical protein HOP18_21045 [Deltaproteobacteria bacterium]|nr:hypothetical protein [Deltaproteobacteria bacterium]